MSASCDGLGASTPDEAAAIDDVLGWLHELNESADGPMYARTMEVIHGLRADVERLQDGAADALVQQARFKGMSVEDGAAVLELESPREIVIAWVWAARQMLGEAPNYSETRIDFPTESASMEVKAAGELDRYVFTVQRAGKLTPHEARQQAEAERDALRAELDAARTREQAVRDLCDEADRDAMTHPYDTTATGSLRTPDIRAALGSATPQEGENR